MENSISNPISLYEAMFFFGFFFPISSICPELLLNCFALVMHTGGSSLYALLPDCSIILLNMKHALSNKLLLTLGQQSVADRPDDSWDLEGDRFYSFKQTHYGNSCHILHSREWCYSNFHTSFCFP